jgi:hypothetical protein
MKLADYGYFCLAFYHNGVTVDLAESWDKALELRAASRSVLPPTPINGGAHLCVSPKGPCDDLTSRNLIGRLLMCVVLAAQIQWLAQQGSPFCFMIRGLHQLWSMACQTASEDLVFKVSTAYSILFQLNVFSGIETMMLTGAVLPATNGIYQHGVEDGG